MGNLWRTNHGISLRFASSLGLYSKYLLRPPVHFLEILRYHEHSDGCGADISDHVDCGLSKDAAEEKNNPLCGVLCTSTVGSKVSTYSQIPPRWLDYRVIIMTVIQIFLLNKASTSHSPTIDLWPFVIGTQIVQCISFVTACIPYLKPFLKSLESGLFRVDDQHGFGTTLSSHKQVGLSSTGKTSFSVKTENTPAPTLELDTFRSTQLHYTASTATQDGSHGWDQQSQTSQSRMIKETRGWAVNLERSANI